MRLLGFTILVIAAATGIQLILTHLPYSLDHVLGRFTLVLMLVLPVIATVGLARAMGIWSWYVFFLAILSPFIAAMLGILFSVGVLHERFYV
ncbi:MAG TPA: hypothetical protein VJQ06_09370 [Rhizomicrobium sp.]|nr:hypothetical protein [Rhizomicrobium sp.]